MIAPTQIDLIRSELDNLSSKERVSILWACESGGRAWGFESTDSDYDVRFIYLREQDDYLRVSSLRDVIEMPISDDLDISGWDLPKALGLLRKSNTNVSLKMDFASQKKGAWPSRPCGDWSTCSSSTHRTQEHTDTHRRDACAPLQKSKIKLLLV